MNIHILSLLGVATIAQVSTAMAQTAPKVNILFCVADDAGHMSAYGVPWINTPAFDTVARNGLLFNNMYTCNAKSAPSRAAMITGRNSWQLEEACNHWPNFPEKFKSYPETLADNGYYVGCTGKGWGLDMLSIQEVRTEISRGRYGTNVNLRLQLRGFLIMIMQPILTIF